MTVQEPILPNNNVSFLISNRALAVTGMVFSPMLVFASCFFAPNYDQPNSNRFLAGLGGVLYLLGAAATATAMRNRRVTGTGKGAFILYVVQMVGLLLAMCFDVLDNAAPHLRNTAIHMITDLSYPFSHLLMFVVGAFVVRARRWRGWRKIPAFLIGGALPLFVFSSGIFGPENAGFTFPLLTFAGFFLLGLAIFTTHDNEGEVGKQK